MILRTLLIAGLLLAGCSENFGPAPPDGGSRVSLRDEGRSGPLTDRTGLSLATGGRRVFVGTDGGLFGFQGGRAADWIPLQGGYMTGLDEQRVGRVQEIHASSDGRQLFYRGQLGLTDALVVSTDGGQVWERLDLPDALLNEASAVGIAPPGRHGMSGAWLAVQGARVFSRREGSPDWFARLLPRAPAEVAFLAAGEDGGLAMAVGIVDADSLRWTLWTSPDPDAAVVESGWDLEGPPLALAWWKGGAAVVTSSGLWQDQVRLAEWPATPIVRADLRVEGERLEWAFLAGDDGAGWQALTGPGGGTPVPVVAGSPLALRLSDAGLWVLSADASLWSSAEGVVPYGGSELDLSIVAAPADGGPVAVGLSRTGLVMQGPASDPAAWVSRGTPLFASVPRAGLFDPAVPDALFLGSFGLYRSDPATNFWIDSNQGFQSYDPSFFAGPILFSALAAPGDGALWGGGLNGDGPYRSRDGGTSWERVHEGLGTPGTFRLEPGLPLITQVRDFAVDQDGATWMAGFRGGVFRLVAGVWENRSKGLPMLDGVPLDSCCVVPGEREVDVRSLVPVGEEGLLAATGWGVFGLRPGAGSWEERSLGLFNQDVRKLLRHPSDSATVLAASTGRQDSEDWLFLTRDGGRTWFPVDSALKAREPVDLVWSDPDRMEVVVLLGGQGIWRMELAP